MALEITDVNVKDVLANEYVVIDFCYCGKPIDLSNPDCIEFKLCKEHANDV